MQILLNKLKIGLSNLQSLQTKANTYIWLGHCFHKWMDWLLCVFRCQCVAVGCGKAGSWLVAIETECRLRSWGPLLIAHCHV